MQLYIVYWELSFVNFITIQIYTALLLLYTSTDIFNYGEYGT